MLSQRSPTHSATCWNYIYVTLWKRQNYRERKDVRCQEWSKRSPTKGQKATFWSDGNVLYIMIHDCDAVHITAYISQNLSRYTPKIGEFYYE